VIAMTRPWLQGIAVVFLSASLTAQIQTPTLKIYLYDDAGVSAKIVLQAKDRATEVLRQAGVITKWYDCSPKTASASGCEGSLESDAISVRTLRDTGQIGEGIFGAAFLGNDGHGQYADIFFDRIRRLSEDSEVSLPDLFGYVVAHEIGHLLLGPKAHTWLGIMKASWRHEQLGKIQRGDLRFSDKESKAMRERLVAVSSAGSVGIGDKRNVICESRIETVAVDWTPFSSPNEPETNHCHTESKANP
jgi:hypothetical protein